MFPCEIKDHVTRLTLSVRFRASIQELPERLAGIYEMIMDYLDEIDEGHAGPAFAIYYNTNMQDLDIEAGFPVFKPLPGQGEIKAGEIPGGTFAVCHYTGPYDELDSAYDTLTQFIEIGGYTPRGAIIEWYLNSPDNVPAEELKTDLALPVQHIKDKEAV